MNDAEKLRLLADWFESETVKSKHPEWSDSNEVSDDLRRIADNLEESK